MFYTIVSVLSLSFIVFGDKIFMKFRTVDGLSDIYSTANERYGGSAYLTSLTIDNPLQLVIFGIIKSFFPDSTSSYKLERIH